VIQLRDVVKSYGDRTAVDGLTLAIPGGEVFAFLGPNGAGKTTTIKLIAGLLRPTSGTVTVCGHDMAVEPLEAKRRLSYVPDHPYLYERLTGREFLTFVGEMYGMPTDTIETETRRLTEVFEMDGYLDVLAREYSHGMRQRTVICAALLHAPDVIVIDEPMVALDPKSARLLKRIFRHEADRGAAVFVSTHTLSVAEEVADRIGIVRGGHMVVETTVADLHERFPGKTLEDIFLELTG
jgi:ABC-2 type transport system ATP-binding protein